MVSSVDVSASVPVSPPVPEELLVLDEEEELQLPSPEEQAVLDDPSPEAEEELLDEALLPEKPAKKLESWRSRCAPRNPEGRGSCCDTDGA